MDLCPHHIIEQHTYKKIDRPTWLQYVGIHVRRMKVPQLWQKWDAIRAQTGGFDKINLQGIVFTGSLDKQLVVMSFFSSGRSSGSSRGELCAYSSHNHRKNQHSNKENSTNICNLFRNKKYVVRKFIIKNQLQDKKKKETLLSRKYLKKYFQVQYVSISIKEIIVHVQIIPY